MSIRAIGITPNYTSSNQNRKAVSFSGQTEDKNKPYYTKADANSRAYAGGTLGVALGLLIGLLGLGAANNIEQRKMHKNLDKLQKYVGSDDIVKDSFEVKDVTGDEKPDMILFKKDGSKVIFDVVEGKFKKEVTTLKEIE